MGHPPGLTGKGDNCREGGTELGDFKGNLVCVGVVFTGQGFYCAQHAFMGRQALKHTLIGGTMPSLADEALIALRSGQRAKDIEHAGELNRALIDSMVNLQAANASEYEQRRRVSEVENRAEQLIGETRTAILRSMRQGFTRSQRT